jgi:hypothetical protein
LPTDGRKIPESAAEGSEASIRVHLADAAPVDGPDDSAPASAIADKGWIVLLTKPTASSTRIGVASDMVLLLDCISFFPESPWYVGLSSLTCRWSCQAGKPDVLRSELDARERH